jgi:hypothetical protein
MALLTITEVSAEFGVTRSRLQRMCRGKRIPHTNLGTDQRPTYMIDRRHVLEWLDSCAVAAVEPLTPATPSRGRASKQITGRDIYERRQARLRA